jgi:hypothetical protein
MFVSIRMFVAKIALLRRPEQLIHAASKAGRGKVGFKARIWIELICQISISFFLVFSGVMIIRSPGTTHDIQKIAAGWIGLVAGYWLR